MCVDLLCAERQVADFLMQLRGLQFDEFSSWEQPERKVEGRCQQSKVSWRVNLATYVGVRKFFI